MTTILRKRFMRKMPFSNLALFGNHFTATINTRESYIMSGFSYVDKFSVRIQCIMLINIGCMSHFIRSLNQYYVNSL